MPPTLEPILPHIPCFMLVMFRLGGIFIFAPLLGGTLIPVQVKILLALVLSFCVYPMIPTQAPPELTLVNLPLVIGAEALIGLVIGYGAALPLIATQIAGQIIGQQLGKDLSGVFNPDMDFETSVVGQMLYLLAMAVFLLWDGHLHLLSVLIHSFQNIPLGGFRPDLPLLQLMTGLMSSMFELAIRIAAPLLCLVFLETIALGFLARTVPQLNIFSLGFPLRLIIGLTFMIPMVAIMHEPLLDSFQNTFEAVTRLLE